MSAVIPLASRSQSTFPRLVFVRLDAARARVSFVQYCTCRVLAPINGHSRFPFTPRERRNARIEPLVSYRVLLLAGEIIEPGIIIGERSRRKLALYRPPCTGKRRVSSRMLKRRKGGYRPRMTFRVLPTRGTRRGNPPRGSSRRNNEE